MRVGDEFRAHLGEKSRRNPVPQEAGNQEEKEEKAKERIGIALIVKRFARHGKDRYANGAGKGDAIAKVAEQEGEVSIAKHEQSHGDQSESGEFQR